MIRRFSSPGFHGVGGIALGDLGVAPPGGAAVPYSLSYDGSDDETDCGTGASIVGLNAGAMTVDCYWQCPAGLAVSTAYTLANQGDVIAANQGWFLGIITGNPASAGNAYFGAMGAVAWVSRQQATALVPGTWYYVRARIAGSGPGFVGMGVSVALVENYLAGLYQQPGTASALHLLHARSGSATHFHGKGNICYIHMWNVDKGALAAVPTTPFAVDANTVGRWIHSEGAGASLGDTSGNANNGAISGATWSTTVPAGWSI